MLSHPASPSCMDHSLPSVVGKDAESAHLHHSREHQVFPMPQLCLLFSAGLWYILL